jgi:hypothetical protein
MTYEKTINGDVYTVCIAPHEVNQGKKSILDNDDGNWLKVTQKGVSTVFFRERMCEYDTQKRFENVFHKTIINNENEPVSRLEEITIQTNSEIEYDYFWSLQTGVRPLSDVVLKAGFNSLIKSLTGEYMFNPADGSVIQEMEG